MPKRGRAAVVASCASSHEAADDVDTLDRADHRPQMLPVAQIPAVGADAIAQIPRAFDVEHGPVAVAEPVHARRETAARTASPSAVPAWQRA